MEKQNNNKLEDLAYNLYFEYLNANPELVGVYKWYFVEHKDEFKKFYKIANMIIRKDKINKIIINKNK